MKYLYPIKGKICFFKILLYIILTALSLTNTANANQRIKQLTSPIIVTPTTKPSVCLNCHGVDGFAVPIGKTGEPPKRDLYVNNKQFSKSVHSQENCVACHKDIKQIPHIMTNVHKVNCIQCHKNMLQTAKKSNNSQESIKLKQAVNNSYLYLESIHAKKNKNNPNRPNATCSDCHTKHNILPASNPHASINKANISATCGTCHNLEKYNYSNSIHGVFLLRENNLKSASCASCHTAHSVSPVKQNPTMLSLTKNCGQCHKAELASYRDTYHGQVEQLGYTSIAKCNDCHGAHDINKVDNIHSKVNINNRLQTCKECHKKKATKGFVTFQPHGNANDFNRYPQIWIASKLMILLLASVFIFFWTHSLLWFYREWKERKVGKVKIRLDKNGSAVKPVYIKRFTKGWRYVHLFLAIAVMGLIITGTPLLFSNSFWAPYVINLFGGPFVARNFHRFFAVIFILLFVGHLVALFIKLVIKEHKTFRWFGPDSLLPRWRDFRDVYRMFKWFFGKGERPSFDKWTYWEKFDYWAPFWGMFIIGSSGLVMWFKTFFASFLPGWIFNVALILHGEEAFLATVFLFSVHYFNCHFRPDKFPMDISIFTGSVTLEEFKKDHKDEYDRLVKNSTLEQYFVGAPSPWKIRFSKILSAILIIIGVLLLALVIIGFFSKHFGSI